MLVVSPFSAFIVHLALMFHLFNLLSSTFISALPCLCWSALLFSGVAYCVLPLGYPWHSAVQMRTLRSLTVHLEQRFNCSKWKCLLWNWKIFWLCYLCNNLPLVLSKQLCNVKWMIAKYNKKGAMTECWVHDKQASVRL